MQYEIKDNKVILDKDSFNEESEIQYLNFVLGYDLLNNFYKDSIYSNVMLIMILVIIYQESL